MKFSRSLVSACLGVAVVGVGLVGCSSDSRREAYLDDPSPALDTLYQREADQENQWAIMKDENWRMFQQDLARAFYYDRPSRLTREPIPRP